MTPEQALANVSGRIGTLAGVYEIEIGALAKDLAQLGPELARHALVTVPHTFDRMAITTRLRPELVGGSETAQLARVARLEMASARELDIELESRPEGSSATTVRAIGNRDLDRDLANLAAVGVPSGDLDRLRDAALALGARTELIGLGDRDVDGIASVELYIRQRNGDDEARASSRERIDATAQALSATGAQRRVVASLYDVLAKNRDTYARLSLDRSQLRLAVRWIEVSWESTIRMMLGFYPGLDAGKKLGELAGAFDADEAAAVVLELGPTEPPAMKVAVSVR